MDTIKNGIDMLQKPFESKADFTVRDLKINRMFLDVLLYSVGGLAVGALLMKGRGPMGFCAGVAGSWKLRGHVEGLE